MLGSNALQFSHCAPRTGCEVGDRVGSIVYGVVVSYSKRQLRAADVPWLLGMSFGVVGPGC